MNSNKRTRVIYILFSISLFAYYLHDKNSKVNNKNITINKVKIFKPKNNSKKEKKIVSIDNVEESKIKIDFTDFQYVELKEHFKDFLLKSQRIMDNDYNIDSLNNETYTDCPFDFKLNKINPLVVEKMNKYIKEDNKYDLRNLSIKFFIEDKIEFLNINQSYLSIYNDIKYYKNSIKDLKKDSVASTELPEYNELINTCLIDSMKKKLTKELIYSLNSNDIHKKHPLGFKKLFIYYYEDINKIEDIALIESLVDKSLNISEKFKDDYMENHFKKSIGFISFSKDLYQYQEEYFPFIAGDYFRIKKEILYLKATSNNDTKKLVEIYSKIDNYFKENFTNIADYNEYYNIKKRYISSEN